MVGHFCAESAFTFHILSHGASCQPIFITNTNNNFSSSTNDVPASPANPRKSLLEAALNESKLDMGLAQSIDLLDESKLDLDLNIINKYTSLHTKKWISVWGNDELKYSPGEFGLVNHVDGEFLAPLFSHPRANYSQMVRVG